MRTAVRAFIATTLAFGVLSGVPATAHRACANAHMVIHLARLPGEALSTPLYWVAEDGSDGSSTFQVRLFGGDCSGQVVSATLQARNGSADGVDYQFPPREVTFTNAPGHDDYVDFAMTVTNDPLPTDAALEVATLALSDAKNGAALGRPSSAPFVILDDDLPTPQISLLDVPYEHPESKASGGVPVFRAGNVSAASTVSYSISPINATPGQDYTASSSGTLTFPPGERAVMIPITVVSDGQEEPAERLQVSISGGPEVTGTTSVQFSIVGAGTGLPAGPVSNLHHPREELSYAADDYRIREIHIFTRDDTGAQIVSANFALRRNMKNGSCAWWTGKKFKKGSCGSVKWQGTEKYEPNFFYYRMKRTLAPSKGKVVDYTAYSRAVDASGNVEADLAKGRNFNTFEIKKGKKKKGS